MNLAQGVRTVAALEACKGVVVLLTGFGLFSLVLVNLAGVAFMIYSMRRRRAGRWHG